MTTMITSKINLTTDNGRRTTYLIIYLLSLIFLQALPASAVKKTEANPINVAYMLAQDTDSASIARTLAYYGYHPMESNSSLKTEDSRLKTEYTHKNGSIIRYSFKDGDSAQPYPYVEVRSKTGARDTDAILSNLGFKKEGSLYQQKNHKHTRSKVTCKHSSNGFLVFHKIPSTQLIINH